MLKILTTYTTAHFPASQP